MNDLPWLVIGDFNEAFWNFEHMSATPWAEALMMDFHDTLETCELVDLGFSGAPFSYDNMRSGVGNVKVRLDRAVALASWQNMFAYSDHVILMLKEAPDPEPMGIRSRRYEVFWERDAALSRGD